MHSNEKLLRDTDEAQKRGDFEAFMNAYADDIVIHMPGKSSIAGTYKGKDQFGEVFQKFTELAPEYTFDSHAYFADDEHGVLLQRSHYKRGDETLDTNDTFVFHFRDGKISEMWISTDDPYGTDAFLG
jgi:ketosteroid isomerase-like protein